MGTSEDADTDGAHVKLFEWAKERGVTIGSISASKIAGKGLGITAKSNIKV